MDWMNEARQLAAQCWCDENTQHKTMDVELAEAVAKRIEMWMASAAQYARNADFYRDLLVSVAKHLGSDAYTSDDGTIQDEPLALKIPELVEAIIHNSKAAEQRGYERGYLVGEREGRKKSAQQFKQTYDAMWQLYQQEKRANEYAYEKGVKDEHERGIKICSDFYSRFSEQKNTVATIATEVILKALQGGKEKARE